LPPKTTPTQRKTNTTNTTNTNTYTKENHADKPVEDTPPKRGKASSLLHILETKSQTFSAKRSKKGFPNIQGFNITFFLQMGTTY
jgi:hypothetical protein